MKYIKQSVPDNSAELVRKCLSELKKINLDLTEGELIQIANHVPLFPVESHLVRRLTTKKIFSWQLFRPLVSCLCRCRNVRARFGGHSCFDKLKPFYFIGYLAWLSTNNYPTHTWSNTNNYPTHAALDNRRMHWEADWGSNKQRSSSSHRHILLFNLRDSIRQHMYWTWNWNWNWNYYLHTTEKIARALQRPFDWKFVDLSDSTGIFTATATAVLPLSL